jgi:phosphonate transport system substrate-binding protein
MRNIKTVLAKSLLPECVAVVVAIALSLGAAAAVAEPIRIGVTPAILHDQYPVMLAFRQYVETKMGRPVELVPRNSYRQIIDMVRRGELDFAWVSAFPYVYLRHYFHIRLVAMPVLNGRPTFRAYLIVPAEDLTTDSILQLKDKVFAYADPYSHTGYVVPRYDLLKDGKNAKTFFARTFFTSGHKNVVRAVASGLADAGSVDSFVWDSLAVVAPQLTAKARIAARSAEFGSPPIVASHNVSNSDLARMRGILIDMAENPEGSKVLRQMQMDGFVAGDPHAFDVVEAMMRATGDL